MLTILNQLQELAASGFGQTDFEGYDMLLDGEFKF